MKITKGDVLILVGILVGMLIYGALFHQRPKCIDNPPFFLAGTWADCQGAVGKP